MMIGINEKTKYDYELRTLLKFKLGYPQAFAFISTAKPINNIASDNSG